MLDVLKERRSIRKYKKDMVEVEKIKKILAAGQMAPSSKNKKPWEFLVIEDKEVLRELAHVKPKGGLFIEESPTAIAIIGREDISDTWIEDCSIAATFIQLEAHNQGLGTCWVQIRGRFTADEMDAEARARELMDIGGKKRVLCILSLGYPNETKPGYKEKV